MRWKEQQEVRMGDKSRQGWQESAMNVAWKEAERAMQIRGRRGVYHSRTLLRVAMLTRSNIKRIAVASSQTRGSM